MHGLSMETYNKIKQIINKYPECEFKLFGSRANGTYKHNSDIDIAVVNDNVSDEVIEKIKLDFANLNIIYKIDFVVTKIVSNKQLIENILNEGVEF